MARTVNFPVVSPACSTGAVTVPSDPVVRVTALFPPSKRASVSPAMVNVTDTLASGPPRLFFARTLIRSANASPAVAVSAPVPAFSTPARVWDGLGGWVAGGVGGFGAVEPPPGFDGFAGGVGSGFAGG